MDLLSWVKQYGEYIKKNPYVYELQKQGIDLFAKFLEQNEYRKAKTLLTSDTAEHFLVYWIPKVKKYLTEIEAYNIVYTLQDISTYIWNGQAQEETLEVPLILEQYGKEYMRLYKARRMINELVGDPVIATKPLTIDLATYKEYKSKQTKKDNMSLYETGWFRVDEVHKDGYISLHKFDTDKYFRVLFAPHLLAYFKPGDVLQITLKKRIFFVYWELSEIKGFYLQEVVNYIN
ncbi:MAG: hypothetical protein ACRCW2_01515 [Cellulosilyticaceae bacterium]